MKSIRIECPSCKGTGLYKGISERDNCAVICYNCNGKGFVDYKYNDFNGRKRRPDIERVFESSCGYVLSSKNCTLPNGEVLHFENYGCTYEEWLNGAKPKPMEELYCPYVCYNQGMGNEPLTDCGEERKFCGRISDCIKYKDKALCWQKFNSRININPNFNFERAGLESEEQCN